MEMTLLNLRRLAFVLCSIPLILGCSTQTATQTSDAEIESNSAQTVPANTDSPVASTESTADVRLLTVDELQATLSALQGRVVLVDMWTTW